MAIPTNILQQVQTYQEGGLAYLQNINCFVSTLNTKFKDFQNMTANLGQTVGFDLPPRSITKNGLVVSFQGAVQRVHTLTIDQAASAAHAFTAQQFIFNVKDYMEKFGKSRVEELSAQIEANVALNAISAVPVMTINEEGDSVPTGDLYTNSGPYRYFGDGVTPFNSFTQCAQMIAQFNAFGAAAGSPKVYLDNMVVPQIVGTGLNQFVLDRNEKIAMSWELGTYRGSNAEYYQSNLLPIHTAGTLGQAGTILTVVSTTTPADQSYTDIVCSGAGTDANAVKSGDLGRFLDGVSGQEDVRFLTFVGHKRTSLPVQFRIITNAASSADNVTLRVVPGLVSAVGINQNISRAITAGMQIKLLPSHKAGLVVGERAFFLGMPALPDTTPFPSSSEYDSDVGVSMRMYFGDQFGKNSRGMVNDVIWNSTLVPEYGMRIIFPLNQVS